MARAIDHFFRDIFTTEIRIVESFQTCYTAIKFSAFLPFCVWAICKTQTWSHTSQFSTGSNNGLDHVRLSGTMRDHSHIKIRRWAAGYSDSSVPEVSQMAVRIDLKIPSITIDWVPLSIEERFPAVQSGKVDLLCGADTITLRRRAQVAFSIPIFVSGIGALIQYDAPIQLREALNGQGDERPISKGSPERILGQKTLSVSLARPVRPG